MTEEFETVLNEMGSLKPPGVSGSRIKKLKELFLANVDQESRLVQKLVDGIKSAPASNKLGPLYVLDAVVRGLIDEMGKSGSVDVANDIKGAPDGTAAAAVAKISEQIAGIVDDSVVSSNDDVKEKIRKLLEIWENCKTFDQSLLSDMKKKSFPTTTPPGSPPARKRVAFADAPAKTRSPSPAPAAASASATATATATATAPPKKDAASVLAALANLAKKAPSPATSASATLSKKSPSPPMQQRSLSPLGAAAGSVSPGSTGNASAASSDPNAIFQMLQKMKPQQAPPPDRSYRDRDDDRMSGFGRRDRDDRGRDRSSGSAALLGRRRERSPRRDDRGTTRGNHPQPLQVDGERNIPSNPHYRERKPFVDASLPSGCIGVYSRTIFVGGVPHGMDERELSQILRPYAEVQSVILNGERKHAFVKVYSRPEAEQVVQAFSVSHPSGLRARWGVGFGPRDCCNYQNGTSTIPIDRLTDADKKWITTAEWGGTGGMPLQPGIYVEEPDIEMGHGVSSKSISRKMPTNSSRNGPKSDGLPDTNGGRSGGYGQGPQSSYNSNDNSYGGNRGGYGQGPQSGYNSNGYGYGGNRGGYGGRDNGGGYGGSYGGNRGGYGQPSPPSVPVGIAPVSQGAPGAPGAPGVPGLGQGQDPNMMANMMAAMQQMQQNQPNGGGQNMADMFQNLANMMRNQQQH